MFCGLKKERKKRKRTNDIRIDIVDLDKIPAIYQNILYCPYGDTNKITVYWVALVI